MPKVDPEKKRLYNERYKNKKLKEVEPEPEPQPQPPKPKEEDKDDTFFFPPKKKTQTAQLALPQPPEFLKKIIMNTMEQVIQNLSLMAIPVVLKIGLAYMTKPSSKPASATTKPLPKLQETSDENSQQQQSTNSSHIQIEPLQISGFNGIF